MSEEMNLSMGFVPEFLNNKENGGEKLEVVKIDATGNEEEKITSLEIAEMAGKRHSDVMRSIRNMEKAWEKVTERNFALSNYRDASGRALPCYLLTKEECLFISSKFNDEVRAKLIVRWKELEIKHREIERANIEPTFLEMKMKAAAFLVDFLRLGDAAKLQLAESIAAPLGLSVPDYVIAKNGAMHSADHLLKERGISMSSIKFNKKLEEAGLIERKTRKGTTGIHKFNCVTQKGLAYGENGNSKHSPNQTQPCWYDDKFDDLLEYLGIEVNGETHK